MDEKIQHKFERIANSRFSAKIWWLLRKTLWNIIRLVSAVFLAFVVQLCFMMNDDQSSDRDVDDDEHGQTKIKTRQLSFEVSSGNKWTEKNGISATRERQKSSKWESHSVQTESNNKKVFEILTKKKAKNSDIYSIFVSVTWNWQTFAVAHDSATEKKAELAWAKETSLQSQINFGCRKSLKFDRGEIYPWRKSFWFSFVVKKKNSHQKIGNFFHSHSRLFSSLIELSMKKKIRIEWLNRLTRMRTLCRSVTREFNFVEQKNKKRKSEKFV